MVKSAKVTIEFSEKTLYQIELNVLLIVELQNAPNEILDIQLMLKTDAHYQPAQTQYYHLMVLHAWINVQLVSTIYQLKISVLIEQSLTERTDFIIKEINYVLNEEKIRPVQAINYQLTYRVD